MLSVGLGMWQITRQVKMVSTKAGGHGMKEKKERKNLSIMTEFQFELLLSRTTTSIHGKLMVTCKTYTYKSIYTCGKALTKSIKRFRFFSS